MEKSAFEQMDGTYYQQGDYFLPNLSVPESVPVGIWGQRHLCYLKKHRQSFYTAMLLSGKLNSYLAEIDQQAQDMFSQLVKQIADHEKITEHLKASNQLEWVRKMNTVQNRAAEIVNTNLIYT
ncbi:MAG: TnpV protein [Oscillospiraceae bacterium]|nr:TnpV protein [Oscillospiraceae bacterium]